MLISFIQGLKFAKAIFFIYIFHCSLGLKGVFYMLKNKNVLLGVTGGIAAYKACDLTSKLTQQGANVRVVMTKSATKFVSPLTFQALSRNPVYIDTFDEKDPEKIAHIDVADWAEIAIIAPATANIIGKLANGIADDMLSTILLATRAKVYIAPAMNVHMYANQAVIENMKKLDEWGYHFIEPQAGYLACGYVGRGRLEEPTEIIRVINRHLKESTLLAGKKVLISAGPTQEKIDPVRYLTNRSSGKMGFSLAEAAANLGADVTLVTGPVQLTAKHSNIKRIDVTTTKEMYDAMHTHYSDADIVIKAAAVSDYRPKVVHKEKVKKKQDEWTIVFEKTEDVLHSLGEKKDKQFLVGFAAETENVIDNGIDKLKRKNLDAIVINDVSKKDAGFDVDTNAVTYIRKDGTEEVFPLAKKSEIAKALLELIIEDYKED